MKYKERKALKERGEGIRGGGPVYRVRRGKVVEVPPEWIGDTVSRQKINRRKVDREVKRKLKRSVRRRDDAQAFADEGCRAGRICESRLT